MESVFAANLANFLISLGPMLLVWIVGAGLAIINWRRCPTAALLTLLAMLDLAFFRIVTGSLAMLVFPVLREKGEMNFEQMGRWFAINGYVATFGAIIGTLLLLAAVFIGRPSPLPAPGYYGPPLKPNP
jgi:hypothetical protein